MQRRRSNSENCKEFEKNIADSYDGVVAAAELKTVVLLDLDNLKEDDDGDDEDGGFEKMIPSDPEDAVELAMEAMLQADAGAFRDDYDDDYALDYIDSVAEYNDDDDDNDDGGGDGDGDGDDYDDNDEKLEEN